MTIFACTCSELTNSLEIDVHRSRLEHLAQLDGGGLFSHDDVRVPGMERLRDHVHSGLSTRNRFN